MAQRVCPVWIGYLLASPIRKLLQDPDKILRPYLRPDMVILEIGPGMGFFSLPMARAVQPHGRVVAVDVEPRMLERLRRRAVRAGLSEWIETHVCPPESLGLSDRGGSFDFALIFAVLHEMPDPARLFRELFELLKPGGRVLLAEPAGHVKEADFNDSLALAGKCGFAVGERPAIRMSRTAVLTRPAR